MKRGTWKRKQPAKSKLENKGYKPPAWFNAIPLGSHGSTTAQKRLWKVCSDTWREEDWNEDPHCRACDRHLLFWKDGHLGHFKKYSLCNSWFKFARINLALICPHCNHLEDGPTQFNFGLYLIEKYGPNHLNRIEIENSAQRGKKMQIWEIVDKAAQIAPHLVTS